MELHHQLLALAQQRGPGVFETPDQLRAALEDFLDEQAASTGDLNLLVDAVRLGAVQMLRTTLQGGAAPAAAVEAAGDYLARQRGSADVVSSRWACAALGFAFGAVPDQLVTDLRRSFGGGTAPSGFPAPWQPAPTQSPVQSPMQSPFQAPYQAPYQSPMPPVGQQWSAPAAPAGKSKMPLIAVGVAAAVLLVGGGVAWALASGDDDKSGGSDDPTTASTEPTTEPTDDPSDDPTTGGAVLEGQTPEQIQQAVIDTMGEVTSLTMSGRIDADGVDLDLSMDTEGRCTGTMGVSGGKADVVSDGVSSFMRGNEAFWIASSGGNEDPAVLEMFVDKWVKLEAGDDSFAEFCDLDNLISEFTEGGNADFEVLGTRSVNGVEALELQSEDGSQLMVANEAPHHILKIVSTEVGDSGEFNLSNFDEEINVNVPTDFVDLGAMG